MILPPSILERLESTDYQLDTIGKSGAGILLFGSSVLKIQPDCQESRTESAMLCWLQDKLPVPKIISQEILQGTHYLLMERLPGQIACDPRYMHAPEVQLPLLAQALRQFWDVATTGCPSDQSIARKLLAATQRVSQGLVDVEDTMPDTFGPGGFRDPDALLHWLLDNQPREESTLSHGDFCLPNILFQADQVAGFLDLGRAGIGSKWNDLALCYRSLRDNYGGRYGSAYPGFDPRKLFHHLGILPDWDLIRYYTLLDELF